MPNEPKPKSRRDDLIIAQGQRVRERRPGYTRLKFIPLLPCLNDPMTVEQKKLTKKWSWAPPNYKSDKEHRLVTLPLSTRSRSTDRFSLFSSFPSVGSSKGGF